MYSVIWQLLPETQFLEQYSYADLLKSESDISPTPSLFYGERGGGKVRNLASIFDPSRI